MVSLSHLSPARFLYCFPTSICSQFALWSLGHFLEDQVFRFILEAHIGSDKSCRCTTNCRSFSPSMFLVPYPHHPRISSQTSADPHAHLCPLLIYGQFLLFGCFSDYACLLFSLWHILYQRLHTRAVGRNKQEMEKKHIVRVNSFSPCRTTHPVHNKALRTEDCASMYNNNITHRNYINSFYNDVNETLGKPNH